MSTKFRHGNISKAKLTPSEVDAIRKRYTNGEAQGALARAYGMSVAQIGRIVRYEAWGAYGEREALHEAQHLSGTLTPNTVEASLEKLNKLLSEPETLPFTPAAPENLLAETCEHGLLRRQFCRDCAEENRPTTVLEKLSSDIQRTVEEETRLANDLEDFLK